MTIQKKATEQYCYHAVQVTAKAPLSGHPWEAEIVSITGAGHLSE